MTLIDQLSVPPDTPFSPQTLPYGVFVPPGGGPARAGVALGDWVLDLAILEAAGHIPTPAGSLFDQPTLNAFLAQGTPVWAAVRERLQTLITAPDTSPFGRNPFGLTLHRRAECALRLPVHIGDYTDFYSSREHATNVGAMFRGPEQALLPNWRHLPIAYHGRSSTITVDDAIRRPWGQIDPADAPVFAPTRELDFELEVGFFVGPGNPGGVPIPIDEAPDHIFGLVLVNDWSARDIQRWEYRPLGPFLGKSFATSISPWIVPLAALAPFRRPGPAQEPLPLPYLRTTTDWALDIKLEVRLQTAAMRAAGDAAVTISRTNFNHLYWRMPQQLTHHASNGCMLRPGDLLASGTISGPTPDSYGSLLELAWGGQQPLTLPNGEPRTFLADGDTVTLTGWCDGDGHRVGFGEVIATILPARPQP